MLHVRRITEDIGDNTIAARLHVDQVEATFVVMDARYALGLVTVLDESVDPVEPCTFRIGILTLADNGRRPVDPDGQAMNVTDVL